MTKDPARWHFQHKWLQDEEFVKYIEKRIEELTSACTKWEAFKAFLRGHIISYTSSKSKKAREERIQLEYKIKTLQGKIYEKSDPQVESELLILRAEYDKLSASKAASSLMRLKQSFFEQGDESGKLLAWQMKQLEVKTSITTVITNERVIVDHIEINDAFRGYYTELYNTKNDINSQNLNRFLDELPIPHFPNALKEDLEMEINKEEIGNAIDNMKSVKRIGPDGLPVDLYKKN